MSSSDMRRTRQIPSVQFGLRGLLVAITAVALVIGLWKSSNSDATRRTGRELDVAIFGRGYFQVRDYETGEICYTKKGRLSLNLNSELTVGRVSDEWILDPPISIDPEWTAVEIDKNGGVRYTRRDVGTHIAAGTVELACFANDEGLREVFPGIYARSDASGIPVTGIPGTHELGYLKQGWLESKTELVVKLPYLVGGVFFLLLLCTLWEVRSLRHRLDGVIARLPNHRDAG